MVPHVNPFKRNHEYIPLQNFDNDTDLSEEGADIDDSGGGSRRAGGGGAATTTTAASDGRGKGGSERCTERESLLETSSKEKLDVNLNNAQTKSKSNGVVGNGIISDEVISLDREGDGSATVRIADNKPTNASKQDEETSFGIMLQVIFPYLVAGLGMVGAGVVLDVVQHWRVFDVVDELFILVPSLLGLKGNLEMTLASRLSTQANLGNMDSRSSLISMICGNMALIQLQAIGVGFLASLTAMVFGWIPEGGWNMHHGMLLCASAILTASVASFVLGLIMVAVILVSRRLSINPDNVATPIAASLGDLTTLALLSWVASMLWSNIEHSDPWLAPVLISFVFLFIVAPLCFYFAYRNSFVNDVLFNGWSPIIIAMAISSVGGFILDIGVKNYKGIAVFQPVMNGVGGNLVAVQASRISTSLHQSGTTLGQLPETALKGCANFCRLFFGSDSNARCHRVLVLLVIPGHLIFMYTISYLKAGHTSITLIFAVIYLCAALLQVVILLYISIWLVHWLWRIGDDPDNCAIPYMTAIGDLLGTGLLAAAFQILWLVGDRDADVGE